MPLLQRSAPLPVYHEPPADVVTGWTWAHRWRARNGAKFGKLQALERLSVQEKGQSRCILCRALNGLLSCAGCLLNLVSKDSEIRDPFSRSPREGVAIFGPRIGDTVPRML